MNWIRIVAAGTIAAIITFAAAVTHGAVAIAGPAILAPFKTSDTTVSLLIKQELDSRELANQNKEISNTGTEDNHAKASKQTVKIHEQAGSGTQWENQLGKRKVVRDAIQESNRIIKDLEKVIRKETDELSKNYNELNNSSSGNNKRLSAKISTIEEKREAALKVLERCDSKEAANMRAYIDSSNSTTKRNA